MKIVKFTGKQQSIAMDIQSVKIDLIRWLTELKDIKILEQLNDIKQSQSKDWWDEISEEERQAIEEGIAQADHGELIPHDEVMKRIRGKFNL